MSSVDERQVPSIAQVSTVVERDAPDVDVHARSSSCELRTLVQNDCQMLVELINWQAVR
jgi:hypothetical protein